jgi:hypothetical protein
VKNFLDKWFIVAVEALLHFMVQVLFWIIVEFYKNILFTFVTIGPVLKIVIALLLSVGVHLLFKYVPMTTKSKRAKPPKVKATFTKHEGWRFTVDKKQ